MRTESEQQMKFLLQLKMAVDCGMRIPTTLCSNNEEEIRQFLLRHAASGVIYTSLEMSTPVDGQHPPRIFQQEINKKYTLRVICSDDYIMAAKLWNIPCELLDIEPCVLPHGLEDKIRIFMQQSGIEFEVFDFGVTADDEYIFLGTVRQNGKSEPIFSKWNS